MGIRLLDVLAYVLVPVVATMAGGVIAAYRSPGPALRSAIQHLAAGVVFAAVAVEILPDLVHERAPVAAVVGFAVGVGLMLVIRRLSERGEQTAGPTGLIVTLGVDIAVDGLLIGIGFSAGAKQGLLLTLALTLELLFLGLSAVTALGAAGATRRRAIATTAGLAGVLAVGATVGTLLLGGLSGDALEVVLAFGTAALLYLVTEELLVEAHVVPETPVIASAFFAGFLALLVLDMVI